ncbi:hypothetical protein Hanom_Chr03g00217801 [Helianthus anomalus]
MKKKKLFNHSNDHQRKQKKLFSHDTICDNTMLYSYIRFPKWSVSDPGDVGLTTWDQHSHCSDP